MMLGTGRERVLKWLVYTVFGFTRQRMKNKNFIVQWLKNQPRASIANERFIYLFLTKLAIHYRVYKKKGDL
jgi:hypothetical protein